MRGFAIPIILLVLALWTSTGAGGAGSSTAKKSAAPTPDAAAPKVPPPPAVSPDAAKSKTPEAKPAVATKVPPPVEATQKAPEPPKKEAPAPAKVVLRKLGDVKVSVGVVSSDTPSADAWKDLSKGQKLSAPLKLQDSHEKLSVKVTAPKELHQVFILLRNKVTEEEVGFIAQVDGEGSNYKVDADLSGSGFDAGTYEILLYLGDFSLEDSLEWVLGELNFKVNAEAAAENTLSKKGQASPNPLYSISYEEKPEIIHMFRQPEPRPPRVVSDAFTVLVLSPILLLFILWIKIGVNLSNFPCTLSGLVFHLGLTGIFGVYALFWIKLTMFEALKWMTIPGLVTFVAGNRLLKYIAERRTK